MDQSINERNRNLYNRHAKADIDSKQAQKARSEALTAPLRKLHNKIKRLLIQRFARLSGRLLDLACGRGGDLLKWIDAEIAYVKGYDISPDECEEAKQRLENIRKEGRCGNMSWFSADFVASSDIGQKVWQEEKPYDAVTCMFALHYFFASEDSAKKAIQLAASNLKEGGYFFGVLPDGKQIIKTLGPTLKPVNFKALKISAKWKGAPGPFGSAYAIALTDTVTQGHDDDDEGSYEFLVYQNVLIAIAKQFDLHPVTDYDDFELEELLEQAQPSSDGTKVFRRFLANFPGTEASVALASSLNCAFVFRKGKPQDDGDGPAARGPAEAEKQQSGGVGAKRKALALEEEEEGGQPSAAQDLPRKRHAAESEKLLYKRSSRFKAR